MAPHLKASTKQNKKWRAGNVAPEPKSVICRYSVRLRWVNVAATHAHVRQGGKYKLVERVVYSGTEWGVPRPCCRASAKRAACRATLLDRLTLPRSCKHCTLKFTKPE